MFHDIESIPSALNVVAFTRNHFTLRLPHASKVELDPASAVGVFGRVVQRSRSIGKQRVTVDQYQQTIA